MRDTTCPTSWAWPWPSQRTSSHAGRRATRGTSILAALAYATLLFIACGAIGWQGVQRFSQPPAVASMTVIVAAGVGIVINGLSAWLFVKGSRGDLNIRGA